MKKHSIPRNAAFTLVEVMIVVVIIGLIAAMMIPAFSVVRQRAQALKMTNAFRIISHAIIVYNTENASWPNETPRNIIPPELANVIEPALWSNPPIDGLWDWDYRTGANTKAGLSFHPTTVDDELFTLIDKRLDDGNLWTGNFRRSGPRKYTLILETL